MRIGIIAAALSLSSIGCGTKDEARIIQASVDDDGNLGRVTLPSGTVTDGSDEYEAAVATETPPIEEMTAYELTFSAPPADGGASGMKVGRFRVRIVPDAGFLAGCVNRSFLHLKVTVTSDTYPDQAFVELHLLGWFEKSQPCFAVMNTGFIGYGWCQKVCVKDIKKGVTATIAGGLAAAGVSASIAKISSYLIAPIATAALAL